MSVQSEVDLTTTIGDGIVQIRLPMAGSPLRHINSYAIEDEGGLTLIDCGWKAEDVRAALDAGLAQHGWTLRDVRRLLITHFHYDHYGLAGTLLRAGVPELYMHALDFAFAKLMRADRAATDAAMDAWLAHNGLHVKPGDDDAEAHHQRTELTQPTHELRGGEQIGRLRVVWTPGHSPGHICLVDARSGRIFTGDHILDPITPHVGVWLEDRGDPLGDFVASLEIAAGTRATGVLPAHGEPFPDLQRRVAELLAHHHTREAQVMAALEAAPASAAAVARRLPWTRRNRSFAELAESHQQFAVAETIAHLEHLRVRSIVSRDTSDALILYAITT